MFLLHTLSLPQVNHSGSFLHHLAIMQKEQQDALYNLAQNLGCLHRFISSLEHSYGDSFSVSSVGRNQQVIIECLWRQKVLKQKSLLHSSHCLYYAKVCMCMIILFCFLLRFLSTNLLCESEERFLIQFLFFFTVSLLSKQRNETPQKFSSADPLFSAYDTIATV